MNFSAPFIRRPIATTLLTVGIALAGLTAFFLLPVSDLPNIDLPTISVSAAMPGASPQTMATTVATPLERHLGTIADVTEMTSRSSVGSTQITLQFGIDRDIDGAARDVQAAIVAARVDLPTALRANPTYRKFNPADFPILILALTSKTLTPGQIYDSASNVLQQKLSQVAGVGDVGLSGSSLPAVRIELNPRALFKYGIGLEDVRAAIGAANANSPKGSIDQGAQRLQIYVNDTATTAADYHSLIVAYRNGAPVRLTDVASVYDGVENIRELGIADGQPGVLVLLRKQPGANVIDTVDRVKAEMPALRAAIPLSIDLNIVNDQTISIRGSLREVERTLLLSIVLVILVVLFFLRSLRAALIPSVAVPLSLAGTFGVMYFLGYSLDNFSLMALTISTGFVVDDAVVVLENISRHVEGGMPRAMAARRGAGEVGFTVLSMSLSLVAVFLPILLMGGLVGKLFREFAVTLSIAIMISLIVSLTTTPMMCAHLAVVTHRPVENRFGRVARMIFDGSQRLYARGLNWALRNPRTMMVILLTTVGLNFYLYYVVPKGFIPEQDTGQMMGGLRADQSISFQAMAQKFTSFIDIVRSDPAVQSVVGFSGGGAGPGGGGSNSGNIFVSLKPADERKISTDQVIARLRPKLDAVAGAQLFLQSLGDIRAGGRQGNAQYQYTLQADTLDALDLWVPRIVNALQKNPELADVTSDQQSKGLNVDLIVDRAAAARLGISINQIDNTLYDAFGQRQVSTIYNALNQYHVVMEVAPAFWQSPETLKDIYVSTAGGIPSGTQTTGSVAGTTLLSGSVLPSNQQIAADAVRNLNLNQIATSGRMPASSGAAISTSAETMVPLAVLSHFGPGNAPIEVDHQGPFAATTISFNLPLKESLGAATAAIARTMAEIHVPVSVHGGFAGTAQLFLQSVSDEPLLVLAALMTIYLVLGILYESYIHPITILSTLPSAGVGAILALILCGREFDLMALIGILLLVGIVKKNAIMMVDFAVILKREGQLESREAIYRAALLRFRPIMMTTMSAIFGALPLALLTGVGSELRQPLGISIIGGLLVSQVLTLLTTPVVYLYLDRFDR